MEGRERVDGWVDGRVRRKGGWVGGASGKAGGCQSRDRQSQDGARMHAARPTPVNTDVCTAKERTSKKCYRVPHSFWVDALICSTLLTDDTVEILLQLLLYCIDVDVLETF